MPGHASRSFAPHADSACPGLLRVVPAADGGLCRVRLPGGALNAAQARVLADAAARFGNGIIETTCRANLQLRGVTNAPALVEQLLAVGLGPRAAGGDDARNLMISPAAGRDPRAHADVRETAAALLDGWQQDTVLHRLSPKFSLLLDGGEAIAAPDHPHDVWLAALPWGADANGGPWFAIGLGGCPPSTRQAASAGNAPGGGTRAYGAVSQRDLPRFVLALLHAFLAYGQTGDRPSDPAMQSLHSTRDDARRRGQRFVRMRALLDAHATAGEALIAAASVASGVRLRDDAALSAWPRPASMRALHTGIHPQRQSQSAMVCAKPRLARLTPTSLRALAALCDAFTSGDAGHTAEDGGRANVEGDRAARLRITPWHGVMLVDVPVSAAPDVATALADLDMAVVSTDPFSRLGCCAGAPSCARSLADVRADATRLARIMPSLPSFPIGAEIHLSGCDRRCAVGAPADVLLLARGPGRYTVISRLMGDTATELANAAPIERVAPLLAAHASDVLLHGSSRRDASTQTGMHESNA